MGVSVPAFRAMPPAFFRRGDEKMYKVHPNSEHGNTMNGISARASASSTLRCDAVINYLLSARDNKTERAVSSKKKYAFILAIDASVIRCPHRLIQFAVTRI